QESGAKDLRSGRREILRGGWREAETVLGLGLWKTAGLHGKDPVFPVRQPQATRGAQWLDSKRDERVALRRRRVCCGDFGQHDAHAGAAQGFSSRIV